MKQKSFDDKCIESRIIILINYIDSNQATQIIQYLLEYERLSSNADIQMFIGSPGGNYLDMMAIYDVMKKIDAPISGTCIGEASGYAALLLSACTKGKRYALKHCEISLFQPYAYLGPGANQQTEVAIEAKEVTKEREVFESALASCTNQCLEKIHEDCEKQKILNAQEALDYGIIDEILE